MEIGALRYFLQIAQWGSMARAAVKLGMTQPALSRQIRKLEQELGPKLFYRHGRGVSLTSAGETLQARVAPLIAALDAAKNEIRESADQESGPVTLGVPPSLGATLSAPLARRFAQDFPAARLRILEGFSGVLSEWIETGRVDVAVLYDARRRSDLAVAPLLREDLFLIQAGATRSEDPADWDEIEALPMILPGSENGLRRVVENAAKDARRSLTIMLELDSVAAIKQLVAAGPNATILPFGAVHGDVERGLLSARPIAEPGFHALLVLATPKNRPITRTTLALTRLVRTQLIECLSAGILRGHTQGSQSNAQRGP